MCCGRVPDRPRAGLGSASDQSQTSEGEHKGTTILIDGCGGGNLQGPSTDVHYLEFTVEQGKLSFERPPPPPATTREGLLPELARIRRQGYAVDNSEYVTHTGCVGAAILDGRRYPIGAIRMHGLLPHLQEKGFDALG